MGKYDPLTRYLKGAASSEIRISFSELERIVGEPLPASKKYPGWWNNNPSNSVMTKAWLAAGFRTEQVDVAGQKVTFRRHRDPGGITEGGAKPPRSPIFGSMKGTTFVMPGVDLTAPMEIDWQYDRYDPGDVIVAHEVEKVRSNTDLNTSQKIRALNKLGLPRAEIARRLGKRYQHVRNVLVAEAAKAD